MFAVGARRRHVGGTGRVTVTLRVLTLIGIGIGIGILYFGVSPYLLTSYFGMPINFLDLGIAFRIRILKYLTQIQEFYGQSQKVIDEVRRWSMS